MDDVLYLENAGLLLMMARRYAWVLKWDHALTLDDLLQMGALGLYRAAETFDPAAGKAWSAWAVWYIQQEFRAALGIKDGKPTSVHVGAVSLDAPLSADDPGGGTLGDMLPDESLPDIDEGLLLDDLQRSVREAVQGLQDAQQRAAVQMCDLEGKKLSEAAQVLCVAPERVRVLRNKGRMRLEHVLRRLTLEDRTPYYRHVGVRAFRSTNESSTEAAALWRIEHEGR